MLDARLGMWPRNSYSGFVSMEDSPCWAEAPIITVQLWLTVQINTANSNELPSRTLKDPKMEAKTTPFFNDKHDRQPSADT